MNLKLILSIILISAEHFSTSQFSLNKDINGLTKINNSDQSQIYIYTQLNNSSNIKNLESSYLILRILETNAFTHNVNSSSFKKQIIFTDLHIVNSFTPILISAILIFKMKNRIMKMDDFSTQSSRKLLEVITLNGDN